MTTIESTPEMAARVYASDGSATSTVARRRLAGRSRCPRSCCSAISTIRSAGARAGRELVLLRPDRVVLQDVLGQTAMLQFMQTRRDAGRGARRPSTATT